MRRYSLQSLIVLFVFCMTIFSVHDTFAEEIPELFPFRSGIMSTPGELIQSEQLAKGDIDAFESDTINVTFFDETLTITKDSITQRTADDYTWFGSGDGISAVLLINGTTIYGNIQTLDNIYRIEYTDSEYLHVLKSIDSSKFPRDHPIVPEGVSSITDSAKADLPDGIGDYIQLQEDSYFSGKNWNDGAGPFITIDVAVGYTEAVADAHSRIYSFILGAIEDSNYSYKDNKLPIKLNLVETREIPARVWTEYTIGSDLAALQVDDDLKTIRAIHASADILILLTTSSDYCGQATGLLPASVDDAMAVVNHTCIYNHSLIHEIGHLEGAGHNTDFADYGTDEYTNADFDYGHGYYNEAKKVRTIMSYDCQDGSSIDEICARHAIWSDPYDTFYGTSVDAGTETDYNAKVIYATASYIASLRGADQTYSDTTDPTITLTGSSVTLEAGTTYSEPGYSCTDDMDDSPTLDISGSVDTSIIGTTTLTYTCTDESKNSAVAYRTITVQDTTKPTITAPDDIVRGTSDTISLGTPTTSDLFAVTTSNNSTGTFPVGETTILWTATDANKNKNTDIQLVTVLDTTEFTSYWFEDGVVNLDASDKEYPCVENYMMTVDDSMNNHVYTENYFFGWDSTDAPWMFDENCYFSVDVGALADKYNLKEEQGAAVMFLLGYIGDSNWSIISYELNTTGDFNPFEGQTCGNVQEQITIFLDAYVQCVNNKYILTSFD